MVTVNLVPLGKEILARRNSPLIDILHELGVEFPCGGKGTCGKCKVRLLDGEIKTDAFHRKRLDELNLAPDWRLACLSTCQSDLVLEVGQYETIIQADESDFEFNSGDGLGVAVDLGTTTLVAQLLDLQTAKVLAVETALNPQSQYGSDLISRLESALSDGADALKMMIREKIGEMIGRMVDGRTEKLERIVIVGNTVMQHFFCGSDIKPLSFYPFESPDLGLKRFTSDDLGWKDICRDISFYPSIGNFVGSDILAGIMATGMHEREEFSVLIDLGTNGEIVIGNQTQLLCASTAAGPAFEGARISMGMLAITGAISSVESGPDGWVCKIIGNTDPKGICGSGLIDAVAELLHGGYLGEHGEILDGDQEVRLAGAVVLTQTDIQEFLLAKAAIAAGLEILMNRLSIQPEDISSVYIAGAFGNYINLNNLHQTGMLGFYSDSMHKLGNTALIGAKMFLFSDPSATSSILQMTSHISLESEPLFQDVYINHMRFISINSV
ncbi:MAG: DUF4445 domain-containing protein [Bacteroidales bacterium]|nr:DUF4445 domain-containing protein [Bacteroidales bacterium]